MKQLAVISNVYHEELKKDNANLTALLNIDNLIIPLGLINNASNYPILTKVKKDSVLVKKLGFSLNYRDKSVIKIAWSLLKEGRKGINFLPIGSDFVGRIIDKCETVSEMNLGDIVIPNCIYDESSKGIPTNCSSKEYQYFNKSELSIIDSNIPIEKASVMGIGLITAHSMIRKAEIKKGDKILITSITSNTSQFLFNLLRKLYANEIYVVSFTDSVSELDGVAKIFSRQEISTYLPISFDVVFDPFADTYIENLIDKLNFGARYIICGIYSQTKCYTGINLQKFLYSIIAKNIKLIGNCLGEKEDVYSALKLVNEGEVDIPLAHTYKYGDSLQDFIDTSFSIKKRLGKVAYLYNTNE